MADLIRVLLLAWLPLTAPAAEQQPLPFGDTPPVTDGDRFFCEMPPGNNVCGIMPHDVTGFTASRVYMLIERSSQDPFDRFAWKSFMAINWPLGAAPMESSAAGDVDTARLWASWAQPASLFDSPVGSVCDGAHRETGLPVVRSWLQTGGYPLVDRSGNYLVYDVRINPEMAAYIRLNGLDHGMGQERFMEQGREIEFPSGHYDNPDIRVGGSEGSVVIKSAWRILVPDDGEATQYRMDALVAVDPAHTVDSAPLCLRARIGLVGMHIMHKTRSANGAHWIWATFEHDRNAPYARDARGPNNIFADDLFPDGCRAGETDGEYLLFDSGCRDCPVNRPPTPRPGGWKWASMPPHARYADGSAIPPAQISRCWSPALSTRALNAAWKQRLQGTVWGNYSLSTTQWKGAPEGELFPAGEVPRFMTNSTMESYLQDDPAGSCLGCHRDATTLAGQPANASFLMRQAAGQTVPRNHAGNGSDRTPGRIIVPKSGHVRKRSGDDPRPPGRGRLESRAIHAIPRGVGS